MRRDWNNWSNVKKTIPGTGSKIRGEFLTEISMTHPKN